MTGFTYAIGIHALPNDFNRLVEEVVVIAWSPCGVNLIKKDVPP